MKRSSINKDAWTTPRREVQAFSSTQVNEMNHMFLSRSISKNRSSLLQVLTKYFQKRLWKIRSNSLTSMVVVKVNPNPSTSSKIREVTKQVTVSSVHYINTHSRQEKVSLKQFPKSWNSRI